MADRSEKRNLLLGVTGSIAGYKSPALVRLLKRSGWQVKVVLTEGGSHFVTPLTLATLTGDQVYTKDSPQDPSQPALLHIDLARWADVILIAPTSANTMSRLARGEASDLLSSIVLATTAPIFIAPSMNEHMWANPATQVNREILIRHGMRFLDPAVGEQACGDMGQGRMREPEELVRNLDEWRNQGKALQGLKILVSAGGTQEPLDPVRFIGNRSSGKMGYALAKVASEWGADVTLISAPTALCPPAGVQIVRVKTANEMGEFVLSHAGEFDIFVSASAVSDWRATQVMPHKIKNKTGEITIKLIPNPDILKQVAELVDHPFLVGFSAETENLLENARAKKLAKGVDLMIANDVSGKETGFESEKNAVWLLSPAGEEFFPSQDKVVLASALLAKIKEFFDARPR